MKHVVLIAGVHGVSGYAAAAHWGSIPGSQVFGLSRRSAPLPVGVHEIIGDLLDPGDLQRKLGKISFTHVVFAAYIEKPTAAERSEVNVAIIKNLFDVIEETSPSLRHVTFYQGGKAYGADLGPFKTPAREDDQRLMPPNFYYDQSQRPNHSLARTAAADPCCAVRRNASFSAPTFRHKRQGRTIR